MVIQYYKYKPNSQGLFITPVIKKNMTRTRRQRTSPYTDGDNNMHGHPDTRRRHRSHQAQLAQAFHHITVPTPKKDGYGFFTRAAKDSAMPLET
jgi:hypothetical protein